VLGIDFDPEVARTLRRKGLPVRYGDGREAEVLESLPLAQSAWVISTLPDLESTRGLVLALRAHHYAGDLAVVARDEADGVVLKRLGVPTVIYPMNNAVDHAVDTLSSIIRPQERRP
jgi:voltage-gated potassium channel Kch